MRHTEEIIELCGSDYDQYRNPVEAAGNCALVCTDIGNMLGWEGVTLIHTHHTGNAAQRAFLMGQASNHFALYVPEERAVVDYTLSQFNPALPFPYVASVYAWLEVLAIAWEEKSVLAVSTGLDCPCVN